MDDALSELFLEQPVTRAPSCDLGRKEEPDSSRCTRRRKKFCGETSRISASRRRKTSAAWRPFSSTSPTVTKTSFRAIDLTAREDSRLRDGVFHRFCEKANLSPSRPHVFIIDEINRGNLSKILGELMLLIEHDKRGPGWATTLTYSEPDEPLFFVPENLYLLGMMNTADRSLSIVDYALRRRFSFALLEPMFGSDKFRTSF